MSALRDTGFDMTKRVESDYLGVLVAILDLMLKAGIPKKRLQTLFAHALHRAAVRARLSSSSETGDLMIAALVLDAWHRNRRYLDKSAEPKAIPLTGRSPSVEAMIRAQRPKKDPVEIARRLKALGLLVPAGSKRYKPSSDVAVVSRANPLVIQHTIRALSALLNTVERNVGSRGRRVSLIERHAEVPDLPRKEVKEFQRFTQLQGKIYLRTVNDWLEARRAAKTSRRRSIPTVRAGVHTYAYFASKR